MNGFLINIVLIRKELISVYKWFNGNYEYDKAATNVICKVAGSMFLYS